MCDYSLCGIPNRLAVEGEQLVVHKFTTGSMGLASPADLPVISAKKTETKKTLWQTIKDFFEPGRPAALTPAVCIPPGAQLVVKDIPADLQRQCRVADREAVTFTQISADVNSYRDAVRFRNGFEIRLQELREGMRVEVLSLAGVTEYTPVMVEALR
jgi:hypothetical protein